MLRIERPRDRALLGLNGGERFSVASRYGLDRPFVALMTQIRLSIHPHSHARNPVARHQLRRRAVYIREKHTALLPRLVGKEQNVFVIRAPDCPQRLETIPVQHASLPWP